MLVRTCDTQYNQAVINPEVILMTTKDVLFDLRTKLGLSQDELAEKVFVTRQAVSRWENGDTVPSTETLKLLSRLFNVSINTLLGAPRQLVCQCCGMPLNEDDMRMRQLLNNKLTDQDLSVRAINCLKAADIETFADLVSHQKSELMKFRNFGKKSMTEIEELVNKHGLKFGMDISKYNI